MNVSDTYDTNIMARKKDLTDVTSYLLNLGISHTESELYIKLLELGAVTISGLSKIAQIPRTTVYANIDKLINRGLVYQSTKNNRKYLVAESPHKLKLIIESMKLEVEEEKRNVSYLDENFGDFLQNVESRLPVAANDSKVCVKYYEGKNGAQLIYREAFESKEVRSYVNLSSVYKFLPQNESIYLDSQRTVRSTIVKEIIDDSQESFEIATKFAKKTNFKFKRTNSGIIVPRIDILIYDGCVAMINFSDTITGSVMINDEYYQHQKEHFDMTWEQLEK